jgi:Biotin/lipoate A/B protein ligase family
MGALDPVLGRNCMPGETKIHRREAISPKLDLPPPFHAVRLREVGDAFAHAVAIAAQEGAGTLVHVGRFDFAEFAVVLEPDEPLRTARRTIYTGMCALGDALAAIALPERAISFDWPDTVRVDGGLVGGARLAWPSGAPEDEPPGWLVFGVMIRLVTPPSSAPAQAAEVSEGAVPGRPFAAALDDEGLTNPDGGVLAEHFARHLMAAFDTSQEKGFGEVARSYLSRLAPEPVGRAEIEPAERSNVLRQALDEEGNLLIRYTASGKVEQRSLVRALALPSWLDPTSGAPRQ